MTKLFNVYSTDGGTAKLLLYGNVGEGDKVDATSVVMELMELEKSFNKIEVHINSAGGDVFNGICIHNALKASKADISIYVDGIAASIASIIAMCGKPLYMSQYAKLMFHAVSGGSFGNASQLRKTADTMEGIQKDLAGMIAKKCGMAEDAIYAKYFADEADHWMSAQEALDMKIIDGIVDIEPDEDAPEPDSNAEAIMQYFSNRLSRESLKHKQQMELFNSIKSLDAFKDVADENAVLEHINGLVEKSALVDSLNEKIGQLEQTIAQMNDAADEAFIDQAIAENKIKAEYKDNFIKLMKADKESTMALVNSLETPVVEEPKPQPKPIVKAAEVFKDEETKTFENMSWNEMDKKGLLLDLKNKNIELFKNKYKETFGVDYID